jgi:hypothetical protein
LGVVSEDFGFLQLSRAPTQALQAKLFRANVKNAELEAAINRVTDLLVDVTTLIRGCDLKVTELSSNVRQMNTKVSQLNREMSEM